MEKTGKPLMMVGVDESDCSFYALDWALNHFFPSGIPHQFDLMVVHAKPSSSSLLGVPPPPPGSGSKEFISLLEGDLQRVANKTMQKVQEICCSKSVQNVRTEVLEGDARNVMCEAAEKHRATILVVGSHGYGSVKRVILGSVSDYCVHHVSCSVMIVKRPKMKRSSSSGKLNKLSKMYI